MINIDTVYQKVLVLANKEQRGYITPQEFNLFANKAQMDIYESYFHKYKTSKHKQFSNEDSNADETGIIEEKLHPFRYHGNDVSVQITSNDGCRINLASLFPRLYRLDSLLLIGVGGASGQTFNLSGSLGLIVPPVVVTEVTRSELHTMMRNPLTAPSNETPVFFRYEGNEGLGYIKPVGSGLVNNGDDYGFSSGTRFDIDYWQVPPDPKWGYVVVQGKALYNSSNSQDFWIHRSDEESLVMRILELAGISMRKQDLQQSVMVDKQTTNQNQNN